MSIEFVVYVQDQSEQSAPILRKKRFTAVELGELLGGILSIPVVSAMLVGCIHLLR